MVLWQSRSRLAHILVVIVRHALAYALATQLVRWPGLARRWRLSRLSGPERLRLVFEDLGGTFIKFGQMLALQPDILSLEYCNALFDLLDRVAPFDYAQVEKTFVEELGQAPSEIFDSFDARPLATASIGQVHVAYLGGRKLAVKVQRPNVETDFAGDIRLMTATISLIKRLRLKFVYWMIEPMSEFVAWTKEELDYRCEARYMEKLRFNARDNRRESVPAVLWDLTTRRTLVTEFFEGETVLAYLRALEAGDEVLSRRLKASGFNAHQVAHNIIDNFLGDVFQHGMFHADLHPANLMILPGDVVGYIDFGITGVISQYSRQNLIALTLAYTRGDLDGMCESFFKVSAIDADSDVEGFHNGLKRLADSWYEVEGKERRLRKNFTLVMVDMLRLSRATSIWPERDVIKYIRSAIAIDGLITRFAPGFDVGRHLEKTCHSYLKWQVRKRMFTYNTLLGWASSSERVLRDGPFRVTSFLQRIVTDDLPVHAEIGETGGGANNTLRRRAVQLGAVVFTISLVIVLTAEPTQFGINLFTAEVVFVASAAMMLWRTIRRLTEVG
jgi:ubiquinone biosynthesis protein